MSDSSSHQVDDDDNDDHVVKSFLESLANPEQELLPLFLPGSTCSASNKKRQETLRQVCKILFAQVEHFHQLYHQSVSNESSSSSSSLSGLEALVLVVNHAETLWGQAELQNEALQSRIQRNIKKMVKTIESQGPDQVRLLDMGDILSENEESSSSSSDDDDEKSDAAAAESEEEDDETRRIRARMERAMDDMENSDDDMDEDDDSHVEDNIANNNKEGDEEESLEEDPAASELNDGFFDINEMEAFADEEEEYLPETAFGSTVAQPKADTDDKKKSFHQKQRDGDLDSGPDDDDDDSDEEEEAFPAVENTVKRRKYRKDSEIEALYKLYQNVPEDDDDDDNDEDDVVNMTAAEFFGKPNKKYYEQWNSKKHEKGTIEAKDDAFDDNDADSWDNHDFDADEGPGWRDEEESTTKKVSFGENQVQQYDKDDEEEEEEDEVNEEKNQVALSSSSHARHEEKLLRQTEQIEKELLAEKPWQMTGESKGTSRPVNSLLEATPEFEVATKMAPLITVEHTANLEDVIKRRILDEDWDDVVPRELPDVAWNKKRGELPEVSQEKSKLGLGELYEREYLKKAVGYDVDAAEKQTDEEKARNEMKALFANLCSKLDALSNYHFAPRPVADEAEVRAVTTPAIAMEEVLPLHVSDARGVAPEEVYGKKKGRDGVLRGETELDQVCTSTAVY